MLIKRAADLSVAHPQPPARTIDTKSMVHKHSCHCLNPSRAQIITIHTKGLRLKQPHAPDIISVDTLTHCKA